MPRIRETRVNHEAYNKFKKWMSDTNPEPEEILVAMSKVSITEQDSSPNVLIGLATLNHMATLVPRVIIDDHWEDVLYLVIQYIEKLARISTYDIYIAKSLKSYIFDILCSSSTCPYPYLRLEIIMLINQIDIHYKYKQYGLAKLAEGFVKTMSDFIIGVLEIQTGNYFIQSISDFMVRLDNEGHLSSIGGKILFQLEQNNPGTEVYFLTNMIKLIGRVSLTASKEFKQAMLTKYNILIHCLCLLNRVLILMFNRNTDRLREVCQHNIILPYVTNLIADITYSILSMYSQIISAKDKFMKTEYYLIKGRNQFLEELNLPMGKNKLPSMHLQWQHGGYLPQFKYKFMNAVSTFKIGVTNTEQPTPGKCIMNVKI
ncbi:unnamed protein product [Meganyctiphanes norvegica]|uniref:Uncharacterized protein n=1 Tax=Meganyctiphanes norvegica TaxID=48144 RepID=A0AAV2QWE7_MEGNR